MIAWTETAGAGFDKLYKLAAAAAAAESAASPAASPGSRKPASQFLLLPEKCSRERGSGLWRRSLGIL